MAGLTGYTDQQRRMDLAFSGLATICTVTCQACGRTYFVTSSGHGDYEDGELELLREKAKANPDKFVEVPDYSSVSFMNRPHDGMEVVIGCVCDPTKQLADFIENNARSLSRYLTEWWKDQAEAAQAAANEAKRELQQLTEHEHGAT